MIRNVVWLRRLAVNDVVGGDERTWAGLGTLVLGMLEDVVCGEMCVVCGVGRRRVPYDA